MTFVSWIFTVVGFVLIALTFVNEVWLFAAWPVVLLAVWADSIACGQK